MKRLYLRAAFFLGLVVLSGFLFSFITRAQQQVEPIVIVPGIMGSWNWDVLKDTSVNPIVKLEGWSFPPGPPVYKNLVDALKLAVGADKVFVAFYDWRRSNVQGAKNYLKPIIDKAKAMSPTGKVNIVAHSMGGILARVYIEGPDYQDDVDQLITLGTPHFWFFGQLFGLGGR